MFFVFVSEFPTNYHDWQQQGITLGIADNIVSTHPILSRVKHLSKLEQVLIKNEVDNSQYQELLVKNQHDYLVEASSSNFFWQQGNTWYTPKIKVIRP